MEFFKENVLLIGLAIGSGVALLFPLLNRSVAGSTLLTVTEAVMLMSRKQVVVVDMREPDDFKQGHLQGARNIPVIAIGDTHSRAGEVQG